MVSVTLTPYSTVAAFERVSTDFRPIITKMPEWIDPHRMDPADYRCGYCGNERETVLIRTTDSCQRDGSAQNCPRQRRDLTAVSMGAQVLKGVSDLEHARGNRQKRYVTG